MTTALSSAALDSLADQAGRAAGAAHEHRRLPAELAEAVSASGFTRHFVPERWGGEEGTFTEFARAGAGLAEECASTAWCAALYAAHGRLAAYLPEDGQRDLWGRSPDVRIAAAVMPPAGRAVAEGDGWSLSGEWAFASGIDHAHWVLLAGRTGAGEERTVRVFAVPRHEFEVLDTWDSTGLRGTGSNTVRVKDVLVPSHRSLTLVELAHIDPDRARCHRVPYLSVAGIQFLAPALGAARRARQAWIGDMSARCRADGRPAHTTATAQQVLTRASAEIHAAELLLGEAARRADEDPVTPSAVAENVRDFSVAAELCGAAVGRLVRAAGARALTGSSPLYRAWQDVCVATGHASLGFEAASSHYAQAVLPAAGTEA
ncbi:acyl-CoA dehydrogenase family protein [Streptomyces sanglieri]|uniref:Oxidoreductase n=1 Tax=Streptomyces sanglieri TaxID=193460 RepID=A0ABW2X3K3_9ACTN